MTIWAIYIGWALLVATGLVARLFLGPRCAHDWQLVDKTEFQTAFEEARKVGATINNVIGENVLRFLRRKVVLVLRCTKCGASKTLDLHS